MAASIRPVARAAACAVTVLLVPGCALLHDNVKGSFACKAPDGTCAPSAVIDDAAIQAIRDAAESAPDETGQDRAGTEHGVSTSRDAHRRVLKAAHAGPAPAGVRQPSRTLRIVLLPHVDRLGRLHEKAVVEVAMAETLAAETGSDLAQPTDPASAPGLLALAEQAPEVDPSGPSAMPASAGQGVATVAASPPVPTAQTGASPVDAIKAEVAASLARTGKAASFPAKAE